MHLFRHPLLLPGLGIQQTRLRNTKYYLVCEHLRSHLDLAQPSTQHSANVFSFVSIESPLVEEVRQHLNAINNSNFCLLVSLNDKGPEFAYVVKWCWIMGVVFVIAKQPPSLTNYVTYVKQISFSLRCASCWLRLFHGFLSEWNSTLRDPACF